MQCFLFSNERLTRDIDGLTAMRNAADTEGPRNQRLVIMILTVVFLQL